MNRRRLAPFNLAADLGLVVLMVLAVGCALYVGGTLAVMW